MKEDSSLEEFSKKAVELIRQSKPITGDNGYLLR